MVDTVQPKIIYNHTHKLHLYENKGNPQHLTLHTSYNLGCPIYLTNQSVASVYFYQCQLKKKKATNVPFKIKQLL